MMRPLGVLMILAAAAAASDLGPIEAEPVSAAGARAAAVEEYAASADLLDLLADDPTLLEAAATGGPLGWFIPQVYVWFPEITGEIESDDAGRIDLEGDLGINEVDTTVMPALQFSLGGLGIRLSAFFMKFSGDGTLQRDITFNGVTFTASERVMSDFEIENYKALLMTPLIKTGHATVALQLGISWMSVFGRVESSSTGTSEREEDLPIPVAGVLVQMRLGRFLFEADIVGLVIDYGDIQADVLDLQLSVGMTVLKVVAIRAGYRLLTVDGEADDFVIDIEIDGFFVGGSIQF